MTIFSKMTANGPVIFTVVLTCVILGSFSVFTAGVEARENHIPIVERFDKDRCWGSRKHDVGFRSNGQNFGKDTG